MEKGQKNIHLLLVDDDEGFRQATATTLTRRGFTVTEAVSGDKAIESIVWKEPDIVLLDLKMPGMGGIETLEQIREIKPELPVIILTGHGDFQNALAGIKLDVIDFLQKPVDIDELGNNIHRLLGRKKGERLREKSIIQLMVSPSLYRRLYDDQPVEDAFDVLKETYTAQGPEDKESYRLRSALVFTRDETFVGVIRFSDLLELVLPEFLFDSDYTSFFTGMFLAQCKVIGKRSVAEIIADTITVEADAPLMKAVHIMATHHRINLPVMDGKELVGIVREKDIIREIAFNMGKI